MARVIRRSIVDEMEDLREQMDALFRRIAEPAQRTRLPPAASEEQLLPATREDWLLPAWRGNLRVDVVEQGDEILVTADMIPGVAKNEIRLDLISPQELRISAERKSEKKEEKENYFLHERTFGSLQRIVPLPRPATGKGASASFRNGVLEVKLKKAEEDGKGMIPIT